MTTPSPLVGYNNNVRHKAKLYHIQTEDSGVKHPHIITHLFADGGRIIASKKTDYIQYLGSENLQEIVKKLMQEQHKAMFIALRDCVYDEDGVSPQASVPEERAAEPESKAHELDLDALERAAEAMLAKSAAARTRRVAPQRGTGRYKQTIAAKSKSVRPSKMPRPSVAESEVRRPKALDEVILSYLADDTSDDKA